MTRHFAEGFQRVFTNDINNIEQRLQEYDPDLYIMWNPKNNQWLVMDGLTETAVMRIPQVGFDTLDARVYNRIREIHVITGFSATREIQRSEEKRRQSQERYMSDLSYNLAKDMERSVKQLAYYGNAG